MFNFVKKTVLFDFKISIICFWNYIQLTKNVHLTLKNSLHLNLVKYSIGIKIL